SRGPALFGYYAALNILDADALLSSGKVRDRLDPAITSKKGIERHHLFPRAYLRDVLGIQDNRQINQIANMALVEWNDNIAISDDAPDKYWPEQIDSKPHLTSDRLAIQFNHHALPENWTSLPFPMFLEQRRKLIAAVIRDAFEELSKSTYSAPYPTVAEAVST